MKGLASLAATAVLLTAAAATPAAHAEAPERMTARQAAIYTRNVLASHFPDYLNEKPDSASYHRSCKRASQVRFTCRWRLIFGDTTIRGHLKLWHRGIMWHHRGAYTITTRYCLNARLPEPRAERQGDWDASCIERGRLGYVVHKRRSPRVRRRDHR